MRIRPARPADLPALLEIYNDAVVHTTASWDLLPWTPVEHAEWYATKAGHGHPVLVADEDGEVVGYAAYGPFRAKAGYAATMEHSVYVRPADQGRGIGRALLEAVVAAARANGVHALIGGLSADNEASVGLHRSLGFVEVGRLPQVGRKFDRWLDLVLVQLILD
ncbi:L-methionine sulfoximine/L-methionine sulfone acetyltransferase [Propionicimonas sp. T2.31MG-18]|uniref:GNAT family N-acetyltransferase n=1 Tax=Propionicimonas sp. T2.31MG-18 TaxID=3157620 RepID=UPI0035E620B6